MIKIIKKEDDLKSIGLAFFCTKKYLKIKLKLKKINYLDLVDRDRKLSETRLKV